MTTPKLVTIALIHEDSKILLIKRNNEPEKDKWALPGGSGGFKIFSEPIDAVREEVKYDLGVEFIPSSPNSSPNTYFRAGNPPVLSLVYPGKIQGEPTRNPDPVSKWKYFSRGKISNLDLAFDHKKIISDYFNSIS